MTYISNDLKSSPWSRFKTRDPNAERIFLDLGRAEVLFSMIVLPELGTDDLFRNFFEAAFVSSDGDPAAQELLIDAFDQWIDVEKEFEALMRLSWRTNGMGHEEAIATLRRACTDHSAMPSTMVHSIFDDPSFDFVAYLAWHNSGGKFGAPSSAL